MLILICVFFVGTFGIVFAPVALSATGRFPGGEGGLLAAALVSGLAVLAMIYALGHISAAHFSRAYREHFGVSPSHAIADCR